LLTGPKSTFRAIFEYRVGVASAARHRMEHRPTQTETKESVWLWACFNDAIRGGSTLGKVDYQANFCFDFYDVVEKP